MKTIWKYVLETNPRHIEMPVGAQVLSAHVQGEYPCIWAHVDPDAPTEMRHFRAYGTGFPMPEAERKFIGTVMFEGGALVFHIFEEMRE